MVLFNTANDQAVVLRNPAIDLGAGTVTARIAGSGGKAVTVFTITNPKAVKPKTTTEDGVTKTTYMGARLALAPGVADVLVSGLGLPGTYIVWMTVVMILFPLCKWYGKYKAAHREKWWLQYL